MSKTYHQKDFENKNFCFPIIKKPFHGSGSSGIEFIENQNQLDNILIDFSAEFLQEKLQETVEVEAGFYLMKEGELVSYYSHQRLRTFPSTGGVSVFSKSTNNLTIKDIGYKILKKLKWSGVAMIEYILDHRDNKYKLIEINPRMWGSIMLSEFCNSNMLDNYINISVGGKTKKENIICERYIRWLFPHEFIYCVLNYKNPLVFLKKSSDTCYINLSYTSLYKSIVFMILTYLKPKKILALGK